MRLGVGTGESETEGEGLGEGEVEAEAEGLGDGSLGTTYRTMSACSTPWDRVPITTARSPLATLVASLSVVVGSGLGDALDVAVVTCVIVAVCPVIVTVTIRSVSGTDTVTVSVLAVGLGLALGLGVALALGLGLALGSTVRSAALSNWVLAVSTHRCLARLPDLTTRECFDTDTTVPRCTSALVPCWAIWVNICWLVPASREEELASCEEPWFLPPLE